MTFPVLLHLIVVTIKMRPKLDKIGGWSRRGYLNTLGKLPLKEKYSGGKTPFPRLKKIAEVGVR